MTKKFGFGIVGCGVISKWHVNAISMIDEATLIGCADAKYEFAEKFAENNNCKAFTSYDELLKCEDIDIVCICTPSGLHAEMAVKAANAKKHFIVEKPMAITTEQLDAVVDACEKNNIKGAVVSQMRFSESILRAKKAVEDGELGDILIGDVYMKYYRSPEYYASATWRGTWALDGGGALMNQGIHGIDALQFIVGKVKAVYGICKTLARDIEVEDTANVLVEYESGAIGTIQGTTSVSPGYPRIISISGTKGTIEITDGVITKFDIEGKQMEIPERDPKKKNSSRDPKEIPEDIHRLQFVDLINAIKNDTRPSIDVYEGRKPVDIILAAYKSSRTNQKVYL